MPKGYGWIVRVVRDERNQITGEISEGDYWLGQRVYLKLDSAKTVKRNLTENNPLNPQRYKRVYVVPATQEQRKTALSVME